MADPDRELQEWIARANADALPPAERVARVRAALVAAAGPSSPPGSGSGSVPSSGGVGIAATSGIGGAVAVVIALVWLSGPDPSSPVRERTSPSEPAVSAPGVEPSIGEDIEALEPPAFVGPTEPEAPVELADPPALEAPRPVDDAAPQRARRLRDETQLIASALEALSAGELARARRFLSEHERRFPAGALAHEREAARARLQNHEGNGAVTPEGAGP
jgi:hypothetical protein